MPVNGLGRVFDVFHCVTPVDLAAGASTGARIHLKNYDSVAFVFYKATGGAAEAPTLTLQEHTANTGGTSTNLAVIDTYYQKEEATLDGDETWTKVTQTAAATVTDADWDDANEVMVVFEVHADQLSSGYEWVSVNIDDPGTTAQVAGLLAIGYNLRQQRTPANLPQPNA